MPKKNVDLNAISDAQAAFTAADKVARDAEATFTAANAAVKATIEVARNAQAAFTAANKVARDAEAAFITAFKVADAIGVAEF